MTQMAEALKRAGVASPDERLSEITLQAMVRHADDTAATIEDIWERIKQDRQLLIALFEREHLRAIGALIYRVRNEIAIKESRGELKRPVERRGAAVVNKLRDLDRAVERQNARAEAEHQAALDREYAEYLASWRKTKIGMLEINGTPIWEVTPGTVRGWLVTQKRRWRTVELLIEGLPDDGRPIGYYRRPDEVEDLWKRAGEA